MDFIQPYYHDAERGILCVLTNNNALIPAARSILTTEDFYLEKHRIIYSAILALADKQLSADPITIAEHLREENDYEKIGGQTALVELWQDGYIDSSLESYLSMVKQKSAVRALVATTAEISSAGMGGVGDASEYLYDARRRILEQTEVTTGKRIVEPVDKDINILIGQIISGETPNNIIPTGFRALDDRQGGLYRGLLTVVAGCTGMGKSAFLLNLAINCGLAGRKVLYYTLEDSRTFVQKRMLARLSEVNLWKLLKNKVNGQEARSILEAKIKLEKRETPLFWIQDSAANTAQISQTALSHSTAHGLDLLIVDHLGYTSDKGKDEYTIVSAAVRGFAEIAKDLDIPVVLAVQLNRGGGDRDKVPEIKNLRGSGHIEEDARAIWFVHRKSEEPNRFSVYVAKSSHGETPPSNQGFSFWCDLSRMYIRDRDDYCADAGEEYR